MNIFKIKSNKDSSISKYIPQRKMTINKDGIINVMSRVERISNSTDEVILNVFDKIEKNCEKNMDFYKNIYMKIALIDKKSNLKISKKVKDNKFDFESSFNKEVKDKKIKNNTFIKKLNNLTKINFSKFEKILTNKNSKMIFRLAFTTTILFLGIPTLTYASDFNLKVYRLFDASKSIASVIIFMFFAVDLINNGTKKGSDIVWQILIKYLLIIIALLGYKTIFNFVDEFFNGL